MELGSMERMHSVANLGQVTVGFDGYLDSIIKVVRQKNGDTAEYFDSMEDFGHYVAGKSLKSGSLELAVQCQKPGGNMPIFAGALSRLDVGTNCIGAVGYPDILPAFSELKESCNVYSAANPGTCQALEFDDGKLMLADNSQIDQLDYGMLKQRIGAETLKSLLERSKVIAFLNWSELKGSMTIWKGFQEELFPMVSGLKEKLLFIDLSDCSHKRPEEIREMTGMIRSFSDKVQTVVSLNQNELDKITESLEITGSSIETAGEQLQQVLRCRQLILHLIDRCYSFGELGVLHVRNKYIEKPKLLTGGGDNFNAGIIFSYLIGLTAEESLEVANAVSGHYVATGISPDKNQLYQWLEENNIRHA